MEGITKRVKTWHGMKFDIKISSSNWCYLGFFIPHPQLMNILIRRGLPRRVELKLQVLHELGHVQWFPLVFAYFLPLYYLKPDSPYLWFLGIIGFLVFWELLAELYVAFKRKDYIKLYREYNLKIILFWATALFFSVLPFIIIQRY